MKKLNILCILICIFLLSSCDSVAYMIFEELKDVENKTNIIEEKDKGLSYSEAKTQSGFFVMKSENNFVPLQEDMLFFNPHPATYNDNIFFTDAKNEKIPKVKESEKIVLFSSKSIKEEYWFVSVEEEGYTIPFEFFCRSGEVYIKDLEFNQKSDYDDYQVKDIRLRYTGYTNKRFERQVDVISNKIAEESYNSNIVFPSIVCPNAKYCHDTCVFECTNYMESVAIAFYAGTNYCEETFYADLKYYIFDGCEKTKYKGIYTEKYYSGTAITPEFTKEGYVVLDTSSLPNGKYVIANLNDRVIFEISR